MSEIERSAIERAIFNISYFERDMDKTTRVGKDLFDALELGLTLMRDELDREKNALTCDGCRWEQDYSPSQCDTCSRSGQYDRYEPKGEKE